LTEKIPEILARQQQALEKLGTSIRYSVSQALARQKNLLIHQQWTIKTGVQAKLQNQQYQLDSLSLNLEQGSPRLLKSAKDRLTTLEQQVQLLDPLHVLKRGFSITRT